MGDTKMVPGGKLALGGDFAFGVCAVILDKKLRKGSVTDAYLQYPKSPGFKVAASRATSCLVPILMKNVLLRSSAHAACNMIWLACLMASSESWAETHRSSC